MKTKKPKNRSISIALSQDTWIDMTNDFAIGGKDELILYVNTYNIVVKNADCFADKNKFWYLK